MEYWNFEMPPEQEISQEDGENQETNNIARNVSDSTLQWELGSSIGDEKEDNGNIKNGNQKDEETSRNLEEPQCLNDSDPLELAPSTDQIVDDEVLTVYEAAHNLLHQSNSELSGTIEMVPSISEMVTQAIVFPEVLELFDASTSMPRKINRPKSAPTKQYFLRSSAKSLKRLNEKKPLPRKSAPASSENGGSSSKTKMKKNKKSSSSIAALGKRYRLSGYLKEQDEEIKLVSAKNYPYIEMTSDI